MTDITETLNERGKTHGDFSHNSRIIQLIKRICRRRGNWSRLTYPQREALDMIAHKMGRILSGNPDESDHWRDIAGYATLVERDLANAKRIENLEKIPLDENPPLIKPQGKPWKGWPHDRCAQPLNIPDGFPYDIYKGPICGLEILNRVDSVMPPMSDSELCNILGQLEFQI